MKKLLLVLTAGFAVVALCTTSCSKTSSFVNPTEQDTSTTVAQDNSDATQATSDAENASTSAISNKNSPAMQTAAPNHNLIQMSNNNVEHLPIITTILGLLGDTTTIGLSGSVDTMKTDFGIAGVISKTDGLLRKGVIHSHFSAKYHFYDVHFSDTITFDNYYVNNKQVQGTIILTRTDDSTFTRQVIGGQIVYPTGIKSTFASQTTRIYSYAVNSNTSVVPATFQVKEYGTLTGTTRNGIAYTATTTKANPLYFDSGCAISAGAFPLKGSIDISSSFFKTDRIINYGTGACDLDFTVKVGSYTATAAFAVLAQ